MRPRSPGWWLQVLGVSHLVVGAVLHRAALADIGRHRVVATVPEHGPRATAFWFLMVAPMLWTSGRLLRAAEDRGDGAAQRDAGMAVAVAGAVGTAAMPVSPFWAVLGAGIAAVRRGRRPA